MLGYIKYFFIFPTLGGTGILYVLLYFNIINLHDIYTKYIRISFFMAFLTAGSFMFSFMATVLFTFSKKLFEDEVYIKIFKVLKSDFHKQNTIYSPLIRLGKVFMICVWGCIITSVSQITIGFIDNNLSTALCISLAIVTLFLIFFLLYHFSINLIKWFWLLEQKEKDKNL